MILHFSFASIIATEDKMPGGKPLKFKTMEEAEAWAIRNRGLALYEAFEFREEKKGE